jgi:hypothetical protein
MYVLENTAAAFVKIGISDLMVDLHIEKVGKGAVPSNSHFCVELDYRCKSDLARNESEDRSKGSAT